MTQDGDDDDLDAQVERLSRLSVVEAGECSTRRLVTGGGWLTERCC